MVTNYRWKIYPYEKLSTLIPKLCEKGDPYTVVANVLFHCSDAIIDKHSSVINTQLVASTFHNEYLKSLNAVYSYPTQIKNGCPEYALSPLNTTIVQKVSPRIRNLSLKRLKSLLHESIYNFGLLNTSCKEKIDVNGLVDAVGLEDFFSTIDFLRLKYKLKDLNSHNVDKLLDYFMSNGQSGRVRSIKFVREIINSQTNLDSLISRSNWSLQRILCEITKVECIVSFNEFATSLPYKKLILQTKEFLESTDPNTGLLRSNWGFYMKNFIQENLQIQESITSKFKLSSTLLDTDKLNDTSNFITWDFNHNCFKINLNNNYIAIRNRKYDYIDSISGLNETFYYLQKICNTKSKYQVSGLDNSYKIEELVCSVIKISLHVEYIKERASKSFILKPSILTISISANAIDKDHAVENPKIYIIELLNNDILYKQYLYHLLDWILSSCYLIKMGHRIDEHIQYLGHYLESAGSFTTLTNIYDLRSTRSRDKRTSYSNQDAKLQAGIWKYDSCSLNKLISSLLGISLPSINNWNQRPLPQMNLCYATLRNCSIADIDNLLVQNGWNYDELHDYLGKSKELD